jgi:hypothetical protein
VDATREPVRADPADANPEFTVERVLAFCKHRWEIAGLAPADIEDMMDELRVHLADAATRGRKPEDVLGPNLENFTREWARARTPWGQRWLRLTVYALAVLWGYLLFTHLLRTTTEVDIGPGFLLYTIGLIALNLVWRPRGRPLTFPRLLLASAVLLVPTLALDVLLNEMVLVRLPLWITGPAAVIAGIAAWRIDRASPK